jgi:hypothetical protein
MNGKPARGYRPTEPPEPTRLTIDEFAKFKEIFEDSPLAKYVVMAGLGGLAGIVLVLIEVVRVIIDIVKHYQ